MRLALDAMGGDHGPGPNVAGAILALSATPDLSLVLVGANVFPKPVHLLQYGVMGSVFARHMLGCDRPTIGLMNVGEEEGKGHELVQKTYELFRNSPLAERFVGNVEGRDLHRGAADV